MGMVAAMVNVLQGLNFSALTTTSAITASIMIMISKAAAMALTPPMRPISSRAISPSERPSRRIEQNSTTKSCTAPPSTAPRMIHNVPGR
jgi:hypothetical protein